VPAIVSLLVGTSYAAIILVADDFSGSSATNLVGTNVDTFDAAIALSGGSGTWTGVFNNLKADGSVSGNNGKSNYIDLGSYINDHKGAADGIFSLTATMASTGSIHLGFSNKTNFSDTTTTDVHMLGGVEFADNDNAINMFAGPGAGDSYISVATVAAAATPVTLTVTLDLTSSFYDGSTKFGKVTWTEAVLGEVGSTTFNSDQNFRAIQIMGSITGKLDGDFDNLTLSQIPEPRSSLLGALGILLLLRRRRRHDS